MAAGTPGQSKPGVTRRIFLKGAAATTDVVTGSGLVTGLPTIWAQKLQEITLLHVGGSYSAIIDIAVVHGNRAGKESGLLQVGLTTVTDPAQPLFNRNFAASVDAAWPV